MPNKYRMHQSAELLMYFITKERMAAQNVRTGIMFDTPIDSDYVHLF